MVALSEVHTIGSNLNRPECVLAHSSGLLFVPDWTGAGGLTIVHRNGECRRVLQARSVFDIKANGIALEPDGTCLLAHLGDDAGGIYRMTADATVTPEVLTVNGKPMPPSNFIVRDRQGRLWVTVSTRVMPRANDSRADASTGFIAVAEPGESDARIVADHLGYTNECVIDEDNGFVFVNETFGRRLTRFDLQDNGSLHNAHTLVAFSVGTYPDGLALAVDGSLWVTSIVSNRVIVIQPDGSSSVLLEDSDPEHIAATEAAYQADRLGRDLLGIPRGKKLKNISNLAFGGDNLNTAYLGNLLGQDIPWFESPVAGVPLPHWDVPVDAWIDAGVAV